MLKKRIIPKLLIKERTINQKRIPVLINTVKFEDSILVGDPISQAKIYESQLADELIVLNLDNISLKKDTLILELIKDLAKETFMPLTVGGGVKNEKDFEKLLKCGADKISINAEAINNPNLIYKTASIFGSQCVVVSVDFKLISSGEYKVVYDRGKKFTNFNVIDWVKEVENRGAGEILLCDVDRDGLKQGLNLEIGLEAASRTSIPIIISGGCGLAKHFVDGFIYSKVEGIAAGTFFSFKDQNLMQTRSHIINAGIPIRSKT